MTILYDYFEVAGGAEQVTINLANAINANIITSGYNKNALEILPKISTQHVALGNISGVPLYKHIKAANLFSSIDHELFYKDKKHIFSGILSPLAVSNSMATKNYYYCHTPPRFAYDLFDYYQKTLPLWQAYTIRQFSSWLKAKYEPAVAQMDHIFANSINVQNRIKQHLNLDATVIYPPVDVSRYYHAPENGYYLSTARLEEYKRVELIVDAFKKMPDKKLVMISGGSLLNKLTKSAQNFPNIKIVGWVEQAQLYEYVSQCIATIYIPIDEDFGMSPVESMAAGKPVIGVAEGGVKETIIDNETGLLLPKSPSEEDLIKAISALTHSRASSMRTSCIERAQHFKPEVFFQKFKEIML